MEQPFDLENFNRKMPYTVPDNFFKDMEDTLISSVEPKKSPIKGMPIKSNRRKILFSVAAAVAAIALLVVVLQTVFSKKGVAEGSFERVELAFNHLSAEDQAFLLDVYEDDAFIY